MREIKIFELTQKILNESEAYVLGYSNQTKMGFWFSKQLTFPAKFLIRGSKEVFKPFLRWAFMTMAFLIVGLPIIGYETVPAEITSLIMGICLYAPMALVMFSVPSTYAYYGVTPKYIDAVVEYLESLNIQETETIESLQANIENINSRIINRVSGYKWLVGASWALFTLLLNLQINIALKTSHGSWQSIIQDNIAYVAVFIGISLVAIWIITSYKKASELLIKTIEFGFVEMKHKMLLSKKPL